MPNHDVECPCGDEWGKHSKDDIGYFCLEPDCKCENSEADVLRAVLSERVVQLAEAQEEIRQLLDCNEACRKNHRNGRVEHCNSCDVSCELGSCDGVTVYAPCREGAE